MTLLEIYASLRRDLLRIISGVQDTRQGLSTWDDTTPNYINRVRLTELLRRYTQLASRYGVYVLVRHGHCGSPNHDRCGKDGYVMSPIDDVAVKYGESRFRWTGGQMYQGSRKCVCPCTPNGEPTEHHVVEDVVYDVMGNQKICSTLDSILSDIYLAILAAGDDKPRSGIREYLLRCLIKINEAVLPVTIDVIIDSQLKMAGSTPIQP